MKKELSSHLITFVVFFALVTLLRGWFYKEIIFFWIGGVVGTFLPDIDHIIYVRFLRPQELSSQRVNHMMQNRQYLNTAKFLVDTKNERPKLIFHSILFLVIFIFLAIFVTTSSGSLFGRGLVIAFLLHLMVDIYEEFRLKGNLANWTHNLPLMMDTRKSKILLATTATIIIFISIFF